MNTKHIQPVLSRVESVSGLASVSPHRHNQLFPSGLNYFFFSAVNMVLLTSSQVSIALSSAIGMLLPASQFDSHVMLSLRRLTPQQSSHVPRLCSSAAM